MNHLYNLDLIGKKVNQTYSPSQWWLASWWWIPIVVESVKNHEIKTHPSFWSGFLRPLQRIYMFLINYLPCIQDILTCPTGTFQAANYHWNRGNPGNSRIILFNDQRLPRLIDIFWGEKFCWSHGIHGIPIGFIGLLYLPTWMVDFYGYM